ncbi:MAG: DNA integrity scanning protein DisA nucleotide-binding domain protein, partial [Clostridiales bacterium]|nr:DNA integrity scanning protein DisA nucleotide-binding domain protein [Clostridiales bacterium]
RFSQRWVDELVKGCFSMGKAKTGALIVIEGRINLDEYVRTGIDVDALLTSQLLINIFEKNTPLHDGAVIVRDERILSATCYLPLSDSLTISKDLGTRHRAALGISEASDSITIVVSEETGRVSVAEGGTIETMATADDLRQFLMGHQEAEQEEPAITKWIRRFKNGKKDSEYSDQ